MWQSAAFVDSSYARDGDHSALRACVAFAAEFIGDGGAALRSTATLLQRPCAAATDAAPAPRSVDEAALERRDCVRLVGKCVTVAADAAARQSERFLLKQLTALLSALRSTAGAVILNSGDVALAICAAPVPGAPLNEEEDDDDAGTGAVDTLCFDARSRPLLRLRGASALKFTSVRGLQLHVLAVLASAPGRTPHEPVRLGLLISTSGTIPERLDRAVSRCRRAEKKRMIATQRAEVRRPCRE
ncbi:hypothetical protein M885DRAFT_255421 [Pelagophyceae sp. CCMP2097]|nr:hypothetical protein M885DRAFT_255421 [Pelagophyceae sp. CCMP2097]